jgi:hypothetical protein
MDSCQTSNVILQENGIIRDSNGKFLGRLVEDTDEFALKHHKRGLREAASLCQRVVDSGEYTAVQQYAAAGCRDKILDWEKNYV